MTNNPSLPTPLYSLKIMLVLSVALLKMFILSQQLGAVIFAHFFTYEYGTITSWSAIITLLIVGLSIWALVKMAKGDFCQFMGISRFKIRQFFGFTILLVVLNIIIEMVTTWLEREPMQFMDTLILTANPVWLLILAIVVIVPIYEEMIFRGFIWSGLAGSALGVWGTAILTSIIFAVIHQQYDWVEWVGVFALAMLFSYARQLSGSLLLPIILHILNNALAMWEYLYV